MKIHGETPRAAFTCPVALRRPDGGEWPLQLAPLPLGFHRRLRERGVTPPVPPVRVARDSSGQPVRDRAGHGVLIADEHDGDYRLACERHQQRVAALIVEEALRNDPEVEFDAQRPTDGEWVAHADALLRELELACWTAGDVGFVCEQVCRISNLLDDHLQEAEGAFSSAGRGREGRPTLRIHAPSNT